MRPPALALALLVAGCATAAVPAFAPGTGTGTDRDGDGVLDAIDKCPSEPEDVDGFEDADGCPDNDDDRDGIPDRLDECPRNPAGPLPNREHPDRKMPGCPTATPWPADAGPRPDECYGYQDCAARKR